MLTAPIPRRLPPVDHDAIAAGELEARRFTYGTGLAACVIVLLMAASRAFS